ncbi:hypothetical protein EDD15DRAFT_2376777 [Pisolithus albus]|nr:hypothetical protein EDD15DRAFT_2376777 [Pisolithus albus]
MSHSSVLTDPPVEEDSKVERATSPSEPGISVRSGASGTRVVPNSSFANVPETPSIDSTSNGMPSVQRSRGDAVLPKGTPSAIGTLRLRRSAVYQLHSSPFPTHSFNSASPKITYVPAEVVDQESDDIEREREEANFVLEAARAQCNVCILEQQLAAAKVEEMVALGNLYRFRAQEAERRLEDANVDVGRIRHDIRKNGVALQNPRKHRRASFTESTVAFRSSSPNI